MSLEIGAVAASAGRPMVADNAQAAKDASEMASKPNQNTSVQDSPTGGVEKTERADAVQATPATSTAVKIELGAEQPADEVIPYPISGPDNFARVMGEEGREAVALAEAANEAADAELKEEVAEA